MSLLSHDGFSLELRRRSPIVLVMNDLAQGVDNIIRRVIAVRGRVMFLETKGREHGGHVAGICQIAISAGAVRSASWSWRRSAIAASRSR